MSILQLLANKAHSAELKLRSLSNLQMQAQAAHRFFINNSRSYISPITISQKIRYYISFLPNYVKFMRLSKQDW